MFQLFKLTALITLIDLNERFELISLTVVLESIELI